MSIADELKKLAELRDTGVLSEDEFQVQKAAVIAGSKPAASPPERRRKGRLGKALILLLVAAGFGFLGIKAWSSSQWEKVGTLTSESALMTAVVKVAEDKSVPLFCAYTGAVAYRIADARDAGIVESIARTITKESMFVGGQFQPNTNMALDMVELVYRDDSSPEEARQKHTEDCRRLHGAVRR